MIVIVLTLASQFLSQILAEFLKEVRKILLDFM
jgi:hypothetical protein